MDEPTVAVGRIARAHGLGGEVSVVVLSEVPDRFAQGAVLWLEDGRRLTVAAERRHRDRVLVRFREVADRTQAEALNGAILFVPASASPDLPEGSWWDHQIDGCAVETDSGRSLGRVAEVIHTSANDVWSVRDEAGSETLVPVLRDVVLEVDVAAKRILVREVPGITTPGDEPPR
ncbi:MAG TPA: ribosome maturation factor RimM [Actinomycetota bacterium]|jgi:16S rRNA processing protein RimM